jgi:non-specific protein-tyrosine kinase
MSRLHRAVNKADREGRLTWTRPLDDRARDAAAVEEAPEPASSSRVAPTAEFPARDTTSADLAPDVGAADLPFSPLFVAATEPGSPAAEQYRLLRTRLETRDATRRTQLLLITSPRLGDGKTTTSANLALTMAREFQHKVVLVEADLRRPTLAAQFGIEATHGLIDVLLGGLSLDDALVTVPGQQLSLLPAGGEAAGATELLASPMMQRTLDGLRARFDRVIVDTTPMAVADTHVLARLADGVLMVVRAGVTPKPALERALASIDRERLLGLVLNEVDAAPGEYPYPGLVYGGTEG